MMGGDVAAASEPGKGSTFTVRLPARAAAEEAARAPDHGEAAGPAGAATVLVVDDDPAVRDFMARFLAAEGLRVVTAADGEEGVPLGPQVRPGLIGLALV